MKTSARDLPARYGAVAMFLHWMIAITIIANICIGLYASDLPFRDPDFMKLMWWHKSIGLLVLILSVLRVAWRWMNPAPPPPKGLDPWIRVLGSSVQHLFYFMIVVIPLAGWLMVSAGAHGHATSFFGLFNWPAFPGLSGLTRSAAHPYHETFETIHVWLAWAMVGLVPLHILAGLYHHFIRGDNVLLRMVPGTRLRSDA